MVYLDITASHEGRKTFTELVKKVAANISIPFTVGGGINELKDVDRLLSAGADKVSINSAALRNPKLIEDIAKNFGSQVCVGSSATKRTTYKMKFYRQMFLYRQLLPHKQCTCFLPRNNVALR